MKYFTITLSFLFIYINAFAQTQRMNHLSTGKTFTSDSKIETIQPLLQKADREFRSFDYEDTFFTLESAVAQDPGSAEALMLRARLKKMVGMHEEAKLDLKMANNINPYAADLYGYNGNWGLLNVLSIEPQESVKKLGDTQKLSYYYEVFDQKMISNEGETNEIGEMRNALQDVEAGNFQEALYTIDMVLQKFPDSALAYDLKGTVLQKQGSLEAALVAFSRAAVLDPDFAITWYNLGEVERSLHNYEKSKSNFDKAIELQDDLTKAYFGRAILHKQMGEKEAAIDDYNTIIDMRGNTYMEAFLNRGLTKKMSGDFTGALTDLDQVIDEFPNNADLRKNRGNLYLLFGMPQRAIDDYTKAVELDNTYAEAYYNRAIAFLTLYDKQSGCADLEKSIMLGHEMAKEIKMYTCTHW